MTQPRLPEVDVLRGIAVIGMVIFHFVWQYAFWVDASVNVHSLDFFLLARISAALFVSIAGLSLYLRVQRKQLQGPLLRMELFRRGVFIFVLGLFLTVASLLVFPSAPIWFGVLHLIGTATVLSIPLVSRPRMAALLGATIMLSGVWLSLIQPALPFWPPFLPVSFPTLDFFPLFPWLGVFWLGIGIGAFAFPAAQPHYFPSESFRSFVPVQWLAWLGRHSLVIYFTHVVLIAALIWLGSVLGLWPAGETAFGLASP